MKKAELEKNGKRLVGIVAFGKSHGSHTRRQSEAKRLPLEDLCVFKEVPATVDDADAGSGETVAIQYEQPAVEICGV